MNKHIDNSISFTIHKSEKHIQSSIVKQTTIRSKEKSKTYNRMASSIKDDFENNYKTEQRPSDNGQKLKEASTLIRKINRYDIKTQKYQLEHTISNSLLKIQNIYMTNSDREICFKR